MENLNLNIVHFSETDGSGLITYVNDAFCETSKYRKEELVGQKFHIIYHTDMPKNLYRKVWRTLKSGEVFRGFVKNSAKDG